MKVLVACEYSGVVRDAFIRRGHEAVSCDLLPTDVDGPHYQGNVLDIINDGWDLMIGHPPCTYLCVSGARWLYDSRYPTRLEDRERAAEFFMTLYGSAIPKVCLENPVGYISSYFRPPDQYVQPFMFGHPTAKKTGLWLKGLPKLTPTNIVEQEWHVTPSGRRYDAWWFSTSVLPYKDRMKARSKTFTGIAEAMAEQWSKKE